MTDLTYLDSPVWYVRVPRGIDECTACILVICALRSTSTPRLLEWRLWSCANSSILLNNCAVIPTYAYVYNVVCNLTCEGIEYKYFGLTATLFGYSSIQRGTVNRQHITRASFCPLSAER